MEAADYKNLLIDAESVSVEGYLSVYAGRICQDSEKLFVSDFLFPLFGASNIKHVVPQYPFIDSEGRTRRIDFGINYGGQKIALEVNGETYHAEGIIPGEQFDDNLNRQNEILSAGWYLLRFSYSQLKSPRWRSKVLSDLRTLVGRRIPELIDMPLPKPKPLQNMALERLDYCRGKGWKKGVVILPTGTGKTFLSAWDASKVSGKILFIVHRLEILKQSKETFEKIFPKEKIGILTGVEKEGEHTARILFASKDTLCNQEVLSSYASDEFDYIIVDEVHHGQAETYRRVLQYFQPNFFMLGLTATPDRTDRKDIFELFDYQKVFEYTLTEAIDNGFLVPYAYYGLTDNIDYSNIRYNGSKYRIEDLDRNLIIPERNKRILEEYLRIGEGNKAIGFCCSIKHAKAMAAFFCQNGVPAVAITSDEDDKKSRAEAVAAFRNNEFNVAFTVDMFNEGIDFPDVRCLLFLRPTESKTIFTQQLGRGLRLCGAKDKVAVIDFIGNYKKANAIRKLLCKGSKPVVNPKTGRVEKIEYIFSPKCEVHFDVEVETIMDRQDTDERDITREDLVGAYYALKEQLHHRPSQGEINAQGEFRIARYLTVFGSWSRFLKEIGEFTEFSYHFPQGAHIGHLLYIINVVGSGKISGSNIDKKYVRFFGGYAEGELGHFQRETKYKIQALMEMGVLVDYRKTSDDEFKIEFTPQGKTVYECLKPFLATCDFSFTEKKKTERSWAMNCRSDINEQLATFAKAHPKARKVLRKVLLDMPAAALMQKYLYGDLRKKTIEKSEIYHRFFESPLVSEFLDEHGLDKPTDEVICRRLPFLFNILEVVGALTQTASKIMVNKFVVSSYLVGFPGEEPCEAVTRADRLVAKPMELSDDEVSRLRETYGGDFLTPGYWLEVE